MFSTDVAVSGLQYEWTSISWFSFSIKLNCIFFCLSIMKINVVSSYGRILELNYSILWLIVRICSFMEWIFQGKILRFLKMLRERGKKLFLLTNSPYYFVNEGMRFMLEVSAHHGRFSLSLTVPVEVYLLFIYFYFFVPTLVNSAFFHPVASYSSNNAREYWWNNQCNQL